MALKIIVGSNPLGKRLAVKIKGASVDSWHTYVVIEVTGNHNSTPNQDSPIIWLERLEGTDADQYVALPLSCFPTRVFANTKADKFWE